MRMTLMASEGGGDHGEGMSGYIAHHLQNLSTSSQTSIFDIHVWNLDTLFWSILCGVVTIVILGLAARKATSGVPGRFQCAIEMLVETVEGNFKLNQHKSDADNVAIANALAAQGDPPAQAIAGRMVALRPHLTYGEIVPISPAGGISADLIATAAK